ncbi:glutamate receptor ionotropic: kainate 2-like protein [Dinothrombium tinctorium]|uniref:Glutamate receptor ionotropic: kainate 2-like protein n=1 Tax=Dinothrombium tinctorium TaxID=1965070 RepID=A0A443QVD2_9ACAR|nr:glutamate receptor ionotropic: kainate 2-like protein [Dinothrombium tinctorium]RWS06988.1 glutamate receptor ionotropic: kainate 2-like protein [Dinothrombium tinctorium]
MCTRETKNYTTDVFKFTRLIAYFYYDLMRLTLESVHNTPTMWVSDDAQLSCQKLEFQMLSQKDCGSNNLRNQLEQSSHEIFGKFGEFVVKLDGSLESYQRITMKINEQSYLYQKMKLRQIAEWEYDEEGGTLFTRALDEDEENNDDEEEGKKSGLIIQLIMHPPFVMKLVKNSTGETQEQKVEYYGFVIDLFQLIVKEIPDFPKYTLEEYEAEDEIAIYGHYGTGKENKMGGGDDQNERTDWKGAITSLGAWTRTVERENKTDFTEPFFELVGNTVVMKKPLRHIYYWKFINVLEDNVWYCIISAYFLTSVLLAIFDRYSPYSYQNNKLKYKDDDEKRIFTLKESMWFCITSLTPQGGGEAPKNNRVEDMEKLAHQYKVRYGPVMGSALQTYFNRLALVEEKFYEYVEMTEPLNHRGPDMSLNDSLSEDERAKLAIWDYPISDRSTKIWSQVKEPDSMPKSYEAGLAAMKSSKTHKEGFALVVDYFAFTHCDVYRIGTEFSPRPMSLAISKNLRPLKKKIDEAIIKFRNDRTIEKLKGKWWDWNPLRQECEDWRLLSNGISLQNAGGTFIVYIAGVCSCFFAIAVENHFIKRMIVRDFKDMQSGKKRREASSNSNNRRLRLFCWRKKNR